MDKKFYYYMSKPSNRTVFGTFEEATAEAKRYMNNGGYTEVFILEAQAVVKQPVPEAEVVKLT